MTFTFFKILLTVLAAAIVFGMEYFRRLDGYTIGEFYPFLSQWFD